MRATLSVQQTRKLPISKSKDDNGTNKNFNGGFFVLSWLQTDVFLSEP